MKSVACSMRIAITTLLVVATFLPPIAEASTMARAAQRSGAGRSHAQPKHKGGASSPQAKPATGQQPAAANKAGQGAKPSTGQTPGDHQQAGKPGQGQAGSGPSGNGNGNRNVNVNIDNSKDITINNNRNTVVVAPVRPYPRPPYAHGGHRYYAYHPYHYHAYRPYAWGPYYHPWGFVVATLAVTAIVVTVSSQQYHYDQGTYYVASNGSYTVVAAPVGATVTQLPKGAETVTVNESSTGWYYAGAYYEKTSDGYKVVAPVAGTVVEHLPDGSKEVKVGGQTYVQVGETFYQPIQKDGKDLYEVVNVEVEKG